MSELRRIALECASRHAGAGEPALSTIARAEVFLSWLEGDLGATAEEDAQRQPVDLDQLLIDIRKKKAAERAASERFGRISNHDFARADQSPRSFGVIGVIGQIGGPGDADTDDIENIKTRLVRTPVDAA